MRQAITVKQIKQESSFEKLQRRLKQAKRKKEKREEKKKKKKRKEDESKDENERKVQTNKRTSPLNLSDVKQGWQLRTGEDETFPSLAKRMSGKPNPCVTGVFFC